MTDENMDARLRAAGEHWRTANDTPAGVDVAATVAAHEPDVIAPEARHSRHWPVFASAAAVVAALVVGGVLLLPGGNSPTPRTSTDQHGTGRGGLVGTVWELIGYAPSNPEPAHSIPPGPTSSDATFYIGADGQLVADDSCAVVGAQAQVTNGPVVTGAKGHIVVGQLTATDQIVRYRSCTDTVGETVFTGQGTKVLDGAAHYEIDYDANQLFISRAGTTMRFVAAPAAVQPPTLDLPTFVGAHWKLLKAVDADGTDVSVEGNIPFFLDDSGKLTTSDGCNGFNAHVSGIGRVRIAPGAMTDVGCPTAAVVRTVLDGTAYESVAENLLTIRKPGAGELTYQWVPSDKAATDPAGLDGKTWRLTSVVGEPATAGVQLTVAGTTYTANDGCQDFTGHVSVGAGSIAFTGAPDNNQPTGSGAGCSKQQADQASTIDSLLSTGGLWAIRNGDLVIWDGAGAQAFALVYTTGSAPAPPTPNPADGLVGKSWYLHVIDPDVRLRGPVSNPVITVSVTLTFDAHGGVRLADSCDDEDGTARIDPKTIDFVDMRGETHSCPSGPGLGASDEHVVWQVLDGTTKWRREGGRLTISQGHAALTFSTTPPSSASLLGTHWKLDSFEIPPYAGSRALSGGSLQFSADGRFTVRGGCAPMQGHVQISRTHMQFSAVSLVGGGRCVDASSDQDRAVDEIFRNGAASYEQTAGQLILSRGSATVHFGHE